MAPDRSDLRDLAGRLHGTVSFDAASIESRRGDGSHLRGDPVGVVFPAHAQDVVTLVQWARKSRVGLVARGGGTSLDGESVPGLGTLVVDFGQWNHVDPLDAAARTIHVQPGVVNAELESHLSSSGLFFPPNPGSWRSSTIGGNVSTNASGPRSFRYGPTRAWVLGVEAVAGTGETLLLGNRAPKHSTGPGLLDLLVGSEGTLALLTGVTLRLARRPERRVGLVIPLRAGISPARVAERLAGPHSAFEGLAAIEYVDSVVSEELSRRQGNRIPGDRPLILLEVEGSASEIDPRLELLERGLSATGLTDPASVYPDANALWSLRGESGLVLDRVMGERLREDVCVPLPNLEGLFQLLDRISRKFGVPMATFGHLGEGNLHPNIGVDPSSPRADSVRAALYEGVHALGGTISGEHGIGALKAPWLRIEHGDSGVAMLRRIKSVFDPDGILNPGKVLPSP